MILLVELLYVLYVLLDLCVETGFSFVVFCGAEVLEYFFSVELSWLFEIVCLLYSTWQRKLLLLILNNFWNS